MTVTPLAVERVQALLAKRGKPSAGIRIGVRTKGCSGLSYTLEYADKRSRSTRWSRRMASPPDRPEGLAVHPRHRDGLRGRQAAVRASCSRTRTRRAAAAAANPSTSDGAMDHFARLGLPAAFSRAVSLDDPSHPAYRPSAGRRGHDAVLVVQPSRARPVHAARAAWYSPRGSSTDFQRLGLERGFAVETAERPPLLRSPAPAPPGPLREEEPARARRVAEPGRESERGLRNPEAIP
jgi:hypothetical protein